MTDIEGSTRRWEDDPFAMEQALDQHDALMAKVIEQHGGWLFKHTGDGVCAAFQNAPDALTAAIELQRHLELPVRMAINTGPAQARGNDYFGPALNRVARLMGAGHGGQILVSAFTAPLVSGAELADLGDYRLRDLPGDHRIYQVLADGLESKFPSLKTADASPGNLPIPLVNLYGRAGDIEEAQKLLERSRLVTLIGLGGVGKTQLALALAASMRQDFPDGVWFVELAALDDPSAVGDVVATALNVTPAAGTPISQTIGTALRGRKVLIVMDNCEHLIDAAAAVIEGVLGSALGVKILATSREHLQVHGEQLYAVRPLSTTGDGESDAAELFIARAQAIDPNFTAVDDLDRVALVEICDSLEGIPLAIELAAARTAAMSLVDIRDRLSDRFRLLTSTRRGTSRHQTLYQAIAWSFDLLSADERALLSCCSAFAGGFDLSAATAVSGRSAASEADVLGTLETLVGKSLLIASRHEGRSRFQLLETVREFGDGGLDTNERHAVRLRHAQHYGEMLATLWPAWEGPGYNAPAAFVRRELSNLRAAYRWSADHDQVELASSIVAHTAMIGLYLNFLEPIGWAIQLLPQATTHRVPSLPRLFNAAGLCGYIGRSADSARYCREAMSTAEQPGFTPFEVARMRAWAGLSAFLAGIIGPQPVVATARELVDDAGLPAVVGNTLLLYVLPLAGETTEAMSIADASLRVVRAHGNPVWTTWALIGAGRAFAEAEPARALDLLREALSIAQRERITFYEARVAQELAGLETRHGQLGRGLDLFAAALDSHRLAGNVMAQATVLAELTIFLERVARRRDAAVLYGASTHHTDASWVMQLSSAVERARAELGDAQFDECVRVGESMELGDATELAGRLITEIRQQLSAGSGTAKDHDASAQAGSPALPVVGNHGHGGPTSPRSSTAVPTMTGSRTDTPSTDLAGG